MESTIVNSVADQEELMSITRRTLIRICSFAVAAGAVLAARNIQLMRRNELNSLALEYNYMRAVEELSAAADNINNTLQKELYAGTADMHQNLAQQLWRDSSTAKAALAQLPVEELQLENTYKFLSQVGNYALSISEKVREGEEITDDEYQKLSSLHDFSRRLCDDMWELENGITSGEIILSAAAKESSPQSGEKAPTVTEGFEDFEEGFDSYPSLIYDGPFSDHILEKKPLMTENAPQVTKQKALERCAMALNINSADIKETSEEEGKMPSWVFSDKDGALTCAVTKNGGYISYFLKSRQVNEISISREEAINNADKLLEKLGVLSMERTYYEEYNNALVINYAYSYDGTVCYTDLIKISVAMDNGEILGYDARGYLVNHQKREFKDGRISILDAQKKVSPKLTVKSRSLAVIPSDSTEELLCYEFKCRTEDDRNVLVYINAYTGKEEQILILYESESGTLAM